MQPIDRSYRDTADMTRMRALLVAGAQANIAASYAHPGALDWSLHFPPDEAANQRDIRLWERDGDPAQLLAFGLHMRHEGTFDLFVHPAIYGTAEHATIVAEYVSWSATRASAAGLTRVAPFWLMTHDTVMIALLQQHGFQHLALDPPPPLFGRPLDDLPAAPLTDGFTVQSVVTAADGEQRASVSYAAFGVQQAWSSYLADYAAFRVSAVYDPDRDLLVRAPDGRGAAACTIWFEPVNAIGLFEPVITHPDFQRRGLGRAVMIEGMQRMRAAGMRRAIVGFDPSNAAALALYTALGFQTVAEFAVYQLALPL